MPNWSGTASKPGSELSSLRRGDHGAWVKRYTCQLAKDPIDKQPQKTWENGGRSPMSYQVQIEAFQGPMDLLLQLIEKQELDIYDIPIATITEQYLRYLDLVPELDLDAASEFLVIAATLLSIKARMLLPRPTVLADNAQDEGPDPRDELVNRLLEYKRYKDATTYLQQLEELQERIYWRQADEEAYAQVFAEPKLPEGLTLGTLMEALQAVLLRVPAEEVIREIPREEITIKDMISELMHRLEGRPQGLLFGQLFEKSNSRVKVIVTFLALLELIRLQKIIVSQSHTFGEIIILKIDPLV
ncbi:MAG: segregation and condensation protein A [Bacillota bacterium]